MEHRSSSHLVLFFTFLHVFCSQAIALPPLGSYSAIRLGNIIPFDGQSESDYTQSSLNSNADALPATLPENENFYFDVSRAIDRNTRHADGLFTSGYSKLLGQLSAKKYLESLISKRIGNPLDEHVPVKRHSDGIFTSDYSRLLQHLALKKYLETVLNEKRSENGKATKFLDQMDRLEPVISEN